MSFPGLRLDDVAPEIAGALTCITYIHNECATARAFGLDYQSDGRYERSSTVTRNGAASKLPLSRLHGSRQF
jgi:hypothetical protein